MKNPAITLVAVGTLALCAGAQARVGEPVPDFRFPDFIQGDGRQSLKEFYGSPVLVEFWGTR